MSAKEMFEELGYEQEISENYFDRFIRYKKNAKRIVFRNDKKIIPYEDYGDMGEDGTLLDMNELKAINQQCKELGWINE